MKLYFIGFTDDDGENLDLFVNADSPKDARKFWADYYGVLEDGDDVESQPVRIWEVPDGKTPGAIDWDSMKCFVCSQPHSNQTTAA